DSAVFGQKDYQQLLVIRRVQADLHLPVTVVAAPTARDPDGLALSSRNQYLDAAERARAPQLHAALAECAAALRAGKRNFGGLEARGLAALEAAGFRPDYFAIRQAADLGPPEAASRNLVALAAGHLGRTRLIDNLLVDL
ncbi:MAG: pantoate--beta-alanine ligase, partial [Gammaproteobacteria bacterium]